MIISQEAKEHTVSGESAPDPHPECCFHPLTNPWEVDLGRFVHKLR